MQKIRIEIDGARARLIDADTGVELRGVTGYSVTHQAGAPAIATITLRARVIDVAGTLAAHVLEV